jgi:hypothetical protein
MFPAMRTILINSVERLQVALTITLLAACVTNLMLVWGRL